MNNSEIPSVLNRPRLLYLDTLRGLAAIWVVLFHMIYLSQPNLILPNILGFLRVGGMGVTLFFIISAFSMCLTMPRHIQSGRWLFSFYTHRICRILPLFYAVLAISLFFFISRGMTISWQKILLNVSCLFNFVPGQQESIVMAGWAIGVEMLFYAVFPMLYQQFNTLSKCILLFVFSMLIAIAANAYLDPTYFKWSILRHLPIFTAGMVFFYAIQKLQTISQGFKNLLGVSLCIGFFVAYNWVLPALIAILPPDMNYYAQLIPFGFLLMGLSLTPLPIIVSSATAFLGQISFSIYLLHPLVIVKVYSVFPSIYALNLGAALSFSLCTCVTMLVLLPLAYLFYVYIEKPGIAFGKMIVKHWTTGR